MKKHILLFLLGTSCLGNLRAQPAARKPAVGSVAPASRSDGAGSAPASAPNSAGPIGPWPQRFGAWSAPRPWGPAGDSAIAIHAHLLPTGQVLSWGYYIDLWSPATNAFTRLPQASCNVFCSGHSFLPDGRLLVAGGHDAPFCNATSPPVRKIKGMNDGNIFDPLNSSWQVTDTMAQGRWYPTNTTLLDGTVLVTAGLLSECANTQNETPDLWQNGTWHRLTGATRRLPLYPMMFAASNGRVFNAGPNVDTGYLDPAGPGSWAPTGTTVLGSSLGGIPGSGMQNGRRDAGTAVMYQPDRLLLIGGSGGYGALNPDSSRVLGVTNTTELIELTATGATFRPGPPMQYPRYHVNSTLLPDGSVLVTGGTTNATSDADIHAVLPAERWLPPSAGYPDGRWVVAAAMRVPRLYHSTALLLPDGRVLSAGGGAGGNFAPHPNAELYSPPYLFGGARPELTAAPSVVAYQEQFAVQTPASSLIERVTLVRLSSVTHSFNMNQRFLELDFMPAGSGGLLVTAPANAICPPGQYLLFGLNSQGVPSVGRVITVDVSRCPPVVRFVETDLLGTPCATTVRITASGTNLGSSPSWYVRGVLQSVPAGQLFVDISLDAESLAASYELEVTPPCGGPVVRVRGTVGRKFPTCP